MRTSTDIRWDSELTVVLYPKLSDGVQRYFDDVRHVIIRCTYLLMIDLLCEQMSHRSKVENTLNAHGRKREIPYTGGTRAR